MGAEAARVIFKAAGDRYSLADTERGIELQLDRLRRERHELIGELSVSCGIVGARAIDGVLSIGTFNVSSPRARQERAKLLAERARSNGQIDWLALLEELAQRTLKADRDGQPAASLRTFPRPAPDDEYTFHGFRLPKHHPSVLFGDGGTLKSYIALAFAGELAQRGLTVGFFDWELDGSSHRERLERLFGPDAAADVRYVRCERPLIYEADRLRRIVRDDGIAWAVYDSVVFGTDGPAESAESAAAYFRAARQVVGGLHIAHITKAEGGDQKPFGSAFWHNGARSTWFAKLAATSTDGRTLTIGLFNRKANLGPQRPAVGLGVTFDADRTSIRPVSVADVDELSASLPIWQRLKATLSDGPRTLAALADELNEKVDTLDRTVRRKSGLFTRVTGSDGVTRIALLERRAS